VENMIRGMDHFGHREAAGIVVDLFWTAAIFTTNSAWRRRPRRRSSDHQDQLQALPASPTAMTGYQGFRRPPALRNRHRPASHSQRYLTNRRGTDRQNHRQQPHEDSHTWSIRGVEPTLRTEYGHEHDHHQRRHGNLLKDWGEGPVVTFSHGWPLSSDAWDGQMLFLAQNGFRAVAHDRRGHGRSSQASSGMRRW
jgi:alpha/beta hydrolase family protein